jgi:hypothetical protein
LGGLSLQRSSARRTSGPICSDKTGLSRAHMATRQASNNNRRKFRDADYKRMAAALFITCVSPRNHAFAVNSRPLRVYPDVVSATTM